MSDPSGITPIAGNPAAQTGGKGQVVQIVSLPDGLQNNARALRLSGEVVRQNDDGSVRVRTPQGDIDIQVRGRQPQQGQQIEIDIPPGSPPKQATIRPAPAQAPQPLPPPQTPPASTTPPPAQPPSTRPAATPAPTTGGTAQPLPPAAGGTGKPQTPPPVQDMYQPAPAKPAAPVASLPPLTPGQIVKLVPYIPTQTPPATGTPPQNSIPSADMAPDAGTIARAAGTANLIAAKGEGNLITTLLNAVKSALPQNMTGQAPLGKPAPQQAAISPLLQTPRPVPSASFAPMVLSAKIKSLILPSGQTMTLPGLGTAGAAPVAAMPVTAPIIQTPQTLQAPQIPQPGQIPSITVTVTELSPQQQPIIPIVMNDKGAVQNFVLQSPPATVPVGTQVTLLPQLKCRKSFPQPSLRTMRR